MNVQIKNTIREGALVIHVDGELDRYTASRLKDALAEGLDGGRRWVVVDLLEVGVLDSTALGVLVGTMRRLKQDSGSLHLVMNDPHLTKIFRITGFEGVFPIHESVDEAVKAVKESRSTDPDEDSHPPGWRIL